MKTRYLFVMLVVLSIGLMQGCKKDEEQIVPVYLVNSSQYTSANHLYTVDDIKGYIEQNGQSNVVSLATHDIKLYKLKYKTALEGDTITASGLLAVPVPADKKEAFPLMSFQHEVITAYADAPSTNPEGDLTAMATYMASTGMIVMIPDYIGFGSTTDEFHPFMNKQYSAGAVVDFIKAVKEFIAIEKPCKTNGKLFLSGYSEGGSVTLAALDAIENDAANIDLTVTAATCGAGIYDLNKFRSWMMTQTKYDEPYYMAYMLKSFSTYSGVDNDYSLVFNTVYADEIPNMFDGVKSGSQINDMIGTLHVGELYNDDFESDSIYNADEKYAGLREAFTENSINAWSLKSDVTFYYGKNDTWVPGEQALLAYSNFKNQGSSAQIKIEQLDGLDNPGAAIPTLSKSVIKFLSY